MAKKGIWNMFVPSPDHYNGFRWCTERYIRIYPKFIRKTGDYKIIKEVNGQQVFISKEEYDKKDLSEKIWEFYLYLYLQSQK